jgi:sugar phosphate isomerase/epimerase
MSYRTTQHNLSNRLYVHLPFAILLERLEQVIETKIQPEIYLDADFLDSPPMAQLDRVGRTLADNGLGCTMHGPFMDICPAAVDMEIRRVSIKRLLDVMQIARQFKPKVIVFHPGYNDLHHSENKALWLKNSIDTWGMMADKAQEYGLTLALENIFEKDPLLLAKLFETINSPHLTHCFDIGHYNVFADYPLDDWLDILGSYITELHLHDNNGDWDEHLALGEGSIDIKEIFRHIKERNINPELVIEAHTEEQVFLSLSRVGEYLEL